MVLLPSSEKHIQYNIFKVLICTPILGVWYWGYISETPMILHISDSEYDYHTLAKVAEMAGLAGIVGFHESEDGYIVSFPDTENTQTLINYYKARLRDLENNIWQH